MPRCLQCVLPQASERKSGRRMGKLKVIIATPHVWDAPYKVGSHQYAKCFSDDGWDVAYISAPITPFHFLYYLLSPLRDKVHFPQRWKSWISGGKQTDNIWAYVPFGLIPIANMFFFNSRWAIDNAGKFLFPPLKKKLLEHGFEKVHAIWLDSPLFGYLLDIIPHEKSVLRIADDLTGFPELGKNVIEAETRLIKRVDMVVVTAESLLEKAKDIGAKNAIYLPNGVDFSHFADNTSLEPEDFKNIAAPRVIYVGSIEKWFNEEWVAYAALNLKNVSFVIIGHYNKGTFAELERLQNVFFLGRRDYADIPAYLRHSHAGIIPFKKLSFINSVNPIKLYEYMACGLPVVSTKWKAIEDIKSPAFLAETKEEFLQMVDKAVFDRRKSIDAYVKFASENSWAKRFEIVKNHLL